MLSWQKRAGMTEEQVEKHEFPAYAEAMIGNYRRSASIPTNISDYQLFEVIEREEVFLFDQSEQSEVIRDALGLPTLLEAED